MVEKYKQPCFDSSLFLAKLNEEICGGIKRYVVFDWLWDKAKNGDFKVCISAITLAEVYKVKLRTGEPAVRTSEANIDLFLELIEEEFVEVIEVGRKTALLANELCRRYNIFPNDGLQLASAIDAKCDVMLAWDRPFIGKTHDSIRIETPLIYERNLFNNGIELATDEEIEKYERESKIATAKTSESDFRGGDGKFIESPASAENGKTTEAEAEIQETNGESTQVKRSDA